MRKRPKHIMTFAVCIDNSEYPASLEAGKLYQVIWTRKLKSTGFFESSTKAVRTMGIQQSASIFSRCRLLLRKYLRSFPPRGNLTTLR